MFDIYHSIQQELRHLAQRLNPIIHATLATRLNGASWTTLVVELDRQLGRRPGKYQEHDLTAQLRILTSKLGKLNYPFDDQNRQVTALGSELRYMRNRWAHGDQLEIMDAVRTHDFALRLLTQLGDAEGAQTSRELLNTTLKAVAAELGVAEPAPAESAGNAGVMSVSPEGIELIARKVAELTGVTSGIMAAGLAGAGAVGAGVTSAGAAGGTAAAGTVAAGTVTNGAVGTGGAGAAQKPTVAVQGGQGASSTLRPKPGKPQPPATRFVPYADSELAKQRATGESASGESATRLEEHVAPDAAVLTRVSGADTPMIGSGRYEYEAWETITVGTPQDLEALPKKASKEKVRAIAAEIAEFEGPIALGRLVRLVAQAFDVHRLAEKRRKQLERQVRQCGLNVDGDGFIWPSDMDPATWDEFRPNDSDAGREFTEISPVEIANTYLFLNITQPQLSGAELDAAVLRTFGRKRRTSGVVAHLEVAKKAALQAAERGRGLTGAGAGADSVPASVPASEPASEPAAATWRMPVVPAEPTMQAVEETPAPQPVEDSGAAQAVGDSGPAQSVGDSGPAQSVGDSGAAQRTTEIPCCQSASQELSDLLYFTDRGADARGRIVGQSFVLLAGSRLRSEQYFAPKRADMYIRQRREHAASIGAGDVVVQDIVFSSPSAAGCFVVGASVIGRDYWRNAAGVPLKQLLEGVEGKGAPAADSAPETVPAFAAEPVFASEPAPTLLPAHRTQLDLATQFDPASQPAPVTEPAPITEPAPASAPVPSPHMEPGTMRMEHSGVVAYGRAVQGGFLLLAGSQIRAWEHIPAKTLQRILDARAEHSASIGADNTTTEDIFFRSPSGAASFVAGTSVNGPAAWK